jgi:hypothetical protein
MIAYPVIPAHTQLLTEAATLLYGPDWVRPLAHTLDVNLRTVQRWAAGQNAVPPFVWPHLVQLFDGRARRITETVTHLRKLAAATEGDMNKGTGT